MNKSALAGKYIELLKASLLNELYAENEARILYTFFSRLNNEPIDFNNYFNIAQSRPELMDALRDAKGAGNTITLLQKMADGTLRPAHELRNLIELSHSMIGRARLDNIQQCMESVLDESIPGDFIETGIWRGGACIFMRGVLSAYDVTDRIVWAADSFEGVPPPTWSQDAGFDISRDVLPVLAVPLEDVQQLFRRYGLLDEKVQFLKGWFKDSLPVAPIEKLAILRLDGDLYESTMTALVPLYDKVSAGGFVIVDDYGSCPPCKQAIDDFRAERGITDALQVIDRQSVFWRKT
ncbi:MAG: TylF/MycF/NovP-related O-methyltransferase [Betaproteobacteria bacterium]